MTTVLETAHHLSDIESVQITGRKLYPSFLAAEITKEEACLCQFRLLSKITTTLKDSLFCRTRLLITTGSEFWDFLLDNKQDLVLNALNCT